MCYLRLKRLVEDTLCSLYEGDSPERYQVAWIFKGNLDEI